MTPIDKARTFIYRNARPIDLARWRYHFENGPAEDVLTALAAYQNPDGGFGHGLEADCWNPNSAPIQTWNAACILLETEAPRQHPIVEGLLRYLASGADFDESHQQWLNTVPTNNDHPHAIWWSYGDNGSDFTYNPTAMLAGFALLHADPSTPLYAKARRLADEAIAWCLAGNIRGAFHDLACFLQLRACLVRAGLPISAAFDEQLHQEVPQAVCTDPEKWRTEYVCPPSMLYASQGEPFMSDVAEAIPAECAFIRESQGDDGSWPVPWEWWQPYKEFEVAKAWWKSHIIIEKLLFLKVFGS